MNDPQEWAKSVATLVKQYVEKAVDDRLEVVEFNAKLEHANLDNLHERVMALEAKPAPEKGEDGKSVSTDEVWTMVEAAVADFPRPKDGKSVSLDDVKPMILEAVAALPKPKDGDNGKSVTLDEVRPIFDAAFATWALECERRYGDQFQRWIETLPKPKDGNDGVGLEDFDVAYDGERTITITLGDKVRVIKLAHPLYRNIWNDEERYERGDTVTLGGSLFIALKDDPRGRPGVPGSDWRLCVKQGRPGKDYSRGDER